MSSNSFLTTPNQKRCQEDIFFAGQNPVKY